VFEVPDKVKLLDPLACIESASVFNSNVTLPLLLGSSIFKELGFVLLQMVKLGYDNMPSLMIGKLEACLIKVILGDVICTIVFPKSLKKLHPLLFCNINVSCSTLMLRSGTRFSPVSIKTSCSGPSLRMTWMSFSN